MTISYRWLQEYIDIPESPEEISKVLTSTGLEVESVSALETVKGGLRGLVIGEVITCTKHPNADKLSLTTVDIGGPKPLSIVCGAPNVAAGQKVVVAPVGTLLYPTQGESFTIKNSKIRGEASEGMICAEDEIGLGASHDGIIVLKTFLPNGTPAADYYKISSDYIIEIGLTPNRADAASHIGVARDIRAAKKRAVRWPSVDKFKVDNHDLNIPVSIENPEACPRYTAVTLSGLTVRESPDWLKNKLIAIGLAPINNLVDVTNFICHELGQPLHAFDAAAISSGKVIVKMLPQGSKFTTLDHKERTLTAQDLMICQGNEGMCIAGVFGGIRSGISAQTSTVFLESACFSPDYIRKSSAHHQLKTDASFRFSRGTDPELTLYALKRAALLMKEVAGGAISSEVVDLYPGKAEKRVIEVKDKNVNRLIGKVIPREEIFDILQRLDIEILAKKDAGYSVAIPSYRVEVLQEADVIEEILRIYGFNNIPLQETTGTDFVANFPERDIDKFRRTVGLQLASQGYFEILTNSLTNAAYQQKHALTFSGAPVEIMNKLSEEQGILRQTMLFTGLEAIAYNLNRQQKSLKFYEFGKTYGFHKGKHEEEEHLALYLAGDHEGENWQVETREVNYHDGMQAVAALLDKCNIQQVEIQPVSDPLYDYAMKIVRGKDEIGKAGKVKTTLTKDFGIRQSVFYIDLSAGLLFQEANPKFDVKEIPRFPEVKRDLSLVLDKRVTFDEIRKLVNQAEKKLIKDVNAFDVYEGNNIPEGKKAYALGFTLLDETKTLTDEEIDQTMNKLMAEFEKKLGAIIRK